MPNLLRTVCSYFNWGSRHPLIIYLFIYLFIIVLARLRSLKQIQIHSLMILCNHVVGRGYFIYLFIYLLLFVCLFVCKLLISALWGIFKIF